MKDKGFTLVELLATMVILAILILIGTMTVSNIFDNSKNNYYKSLENTLSIAGNEYFNDNREDKPIDDYNFVNMDTLVSHEYMDELKTYDGKESCKSETGVYIYNDGNDNGYEVCLVCGDYKSPGEFCNGKKMGVINITGNINDPNGPAYNPLLSYSGTTWINASSVYIHFNLVDEGVNVSKYKIYNSTGGEFGDCTADNNYCMQEFTTTGSYSVEAYDGGTKVGNRKYFNVKLDNVPPTMDLKNLEEEFLLEDNKIVYEYKNEVININDDNGYKEVKYTLTRYTPTETQYIARDVDIKDADFKIKESLQSGKYDLYITVTDFAGNVATKKHTHITFYIKYKVDLQYFDKNDQRHDIGSIKVYTYGMYDGLPGKVNLNSNPQEVSWYANANMVGGVTTSTTPVSKTSYHVLYGKEDKLKVSFGVTCNDITYDSEYHQLATIPTDEQGKYRLMVYYGGTLMSNEAKDARNYTIIAMLNPGYTWDDGSTKARAKQCEILPKKVPKPSCTNPTYDATRKKLVTLVDDNGVYKMFNETAYSLNGSPWGVNATSYPFTVTLNGNKNYSWEGTSNYDFSTINLSCVINTKKIPFPYKCCKDCVFDGSYQILVDGFNLFDQGVFDDQGEQPLVFYDEEISQDNVSQEEMSALWDEFYYADYNNDGDIAFANDSGGDGSESGVPAFTVNPYTATNADIYPVIFKIINTNYEFEGGGTEKTLYCEVKKASVSISWDKIKFEWDNQNHVATLSQDTLNTIGDNEGSNQGNFWDTIHYHVTGEEKDLGKHTATFVCDSIGELKKGCGNISFSNTNQDFEIVDTTPPTCNISVSKNGTLSYSSKDEYGIFEYLVGDESDYSGPIDGELMTCPYPEDSNATNEKSISESSTITKSGTYTLTTFDCSYNSKKCSITVKKQKSTATCKKYTRGTTCEKWGKWSDYGTCSTDNKETNWNTKQCIKCDGEGEEGYKCRTRLCSEYNITGCSEWNDWSSWTNDDNCSEGTASDYSSKTKCQFTT